MQQGPWESDYHSATQEIFHLFVNQKGHCLVQQSSQSVPIILRQINPIHTLPLYFR
jgi:hypothetical protein